MSDKKVPSISEQIISKVDSIIAVIDDKKQVSEMLKDFKNVISQVELEVISGDKQPCLPTMVENENG